MAEQLLRREKDKVKEINLLRTEVCGNLWLPTPLTDIAPRERDLSWFLCVPE